MLITRVSGQANRVKCMVFFVEKNSIDSGLIQGHVEMKQTLNYDYSTVGSLYEALFERLFFAKRVPYMVNFSEI